MPDINQPDPTPTPVLEIDPTDVLTERIVNLLTPAFLDPAKGDEDLARAAAFKALCDYYDNTPGDLLNIAQTIMFGLATIEATGRSLAPDVPDATFLRLTGRANALARSEARSRKAMLDYSIPQSQPELPDWSTIPEPEQPPGRGQGRSSPPGRHPTATDTGRGANQPKFQRPPSIPDHTHPSIGRHNAIQQRARPGARQCLLPSDDRSASRGWRISAWNTCRGRIGGALRDQQERLGSHDATLEPRGAANAPQDVGCLVKHSHDHRTAVIGHEGDPVTLLLQPLPAWHQQSRIRPWSRKERTTLVLDAVDSGRNCVAQVPRRFRSLKAFEMMHKVRDVLLRLA